MGVFKDFFSSKSNSSDGKSKSIFRARTTVRGKTSYNQDRMSKPKSGGRGTHSGYEVNYSKGKGREYGR